MTGLLVQDALAECPGRESCGSLKTAKTLLDYLQHPGQVRWRNNAPRPAPDPARLEHAQERRPPGVARTQERRGS